MTKKKQGLRTWRDEERIPTDDFEEIIYEKDPPLGRIILNAPEKRNALTYDRKNEIVMALMEMELDDDIKVVIIKGAGTSFCSGYDITPPPPGESGRNMAPGGAYVRSGRDRVMNANYQQMFRDLYSYIFDFQKPVIAQIHGFCLAGGTHLASFCDLRIVAEDAQIGYPVSRNWTAGGYQFMPWLIGLTKAKYYMFTGRPMDGQTSYEWGWASDVFPEATLEEETEKIARDIALVDTDLIMLTKRSINRQMELMGFKTGMMWSMDLNALVGFRESQQQGDEFRQIAAEDGLKAALSWRDRSYSLSYRTSDRATRDRNQPS
ncbi:MAG TPA: enoyl-CoA hydratase-related protein [Dehalococcoidia bacterium]|nr:enoyl-CoA hydratase-related protein [Dehalococcoidia bacterium]